MSSTPLNPLVADYLARVDVEARILPDQNRQELLERLRGLFEMRLTETSSDADVRYLLRAIGPPLEVVAGATLTLDLGDHSQPSDLPVVDYTQPLHPLVEDYLARFDAEARVLPDHERQELLEMLREYLAVGLTETTSDADVRNLLEIAGSPSQIVAVATQGLEVGDTQPSTSQVRSAAPPPHPSAKVEPWGKVEIIAVLGLTAGAVLIPVLGPVIGLCFVWASAQWTSREKGVATVLTLLPVIALTLGFVLASRDGPPDDAVTVSPVSQQPVGALS